MNHLDSLLDRQKAAELRLADAQAALRNAQDGFDAAKAKATDATLDPEQSQAAEAELAQAEQALAEAKLAEQAAQDAKADIDAEVEAALAEQAELAELEEQAQARVDAAGAAQKDADEKVAAAQRRVEAAPDAGERASAAASLNEALENQASASDGLKAAAQHRQSAAAETAQAGLAQANGDGPEPVSAPKPKTEETRVSHIRQYESPEFPNAPAPDHPDTRTTVDLLSHVAPMPDYKRMAEKSASRPAEEVFPMAAEETLDTTRQKRQGVAEGIVQTAHHPDNQDVREGQLKPGEKLYAFANAVKGEALGEKDDRSPYYVSESQVRAMVDHGLIDFDRKTINADGVRDYLALPESNQANCLVEATAVVPTRYVETRVGPADWARETEFATGETYTELNRRGGGGYQIHPDLTALNQGRADPKTLPIATLDGKTWDFREFSKENRPLTEAQREAISADYVERRDVALERDTRLEGIEGLSREQAELKARIQDKLGETQDYAHPEVRELRQDATRIDQALKEQRGEWAERCVSQPQVYAPLDDAMRKDVERQQQREAQSRAALEGRQDRQGADAEQRAAERARLERELELARREVFADRRGMGLGM